MSPLTPKSFFKAVPKTDLNHEELNVKVVIQYKLVQYGGYQNEL